MILYGLLSLLYGLLIVVSFYQVAPWAALRLFERRTNARFFARLEKERGPETWARLLSDHPTTAARAATLRVDGAGAPAMDTAGWAALRAICRDP